MAPLIRMSEFSKHVLLLTAMIITVLDSAVASLNLEIQLVSHNILRNQLLKTNIELRLCLQPTQALPKASSCPYGEFVLPMSTQNDGAISIRMLNKGGMFSSQSVLFTDFWPHGEFQLVIEASAAGTGFIQDELIEAIIIPFNRTLPIMNTSTSLMLYGILQLKTLVSLRYKISSDCLSGEYGKDCELQCVPRDHTSACQSVCNYLGETVCLKESSDLSLQERFETAIIRGQRDTGQQPQSGGLDTNTLIITVVVSIFGGYLLILFVLVVIFVSCFVRCNNGKCKLTKKARIKCPERFSKGADKICNYFHCSSCCDQACDNDELMFWIEMVILAVVCFPFALCCLVLWGVLTGGR